MNIRGNYNNTIEFLKKENDEIHKLRRNRTLKENRLFHTSSKSEYTAHAVINSIAKLYLNVCDEISSYPSKIEKIDFILPKEYTELIHNTFLHIYWKMSNFRDSKHEKYTIQQINQNFDLIQSIIFSMSSNLEIFTNMLLTDYNTYSLINHIYSFNRFEKSDNDDIDHILLLNEKQFMEIMDILSEHIYEFTLMSDIVDECYEIFGEIENNGIISSELINYHVNIVEEY